MIGRMQRNGVKQYYNRKKSFEMYDNLDRGFLHSDFEGSLSAQVFL